jgi:hypothetical protein
MVLVIMMMMMKRCAMVTMTEISCWKKCEVYVEKKEPDPEMVLVGQDPGERIPGVSKPWLV